MELQVERRDVAAIVAATFPEYNGRKFVVCPGTHATITNVNWSEGTLYTYRACSLSGEYAGSLERFAMTAPWNHGVEGKRVEIPAGCCIVAHLIVSGRDYGLRIYVRPENMPSQIAKPVELTPVELLVLRCTTAYKASYNGKDRYAMAADDARWGYARTIQGFNADNFPSRTVWDAAKTSLIGRGLLDKRGAMNRYGANTLSTINAMASA